jgi:hypothetical protein
MKTRQATRKRLTLPGRYSTGLGEPQDVDLQDLSSGGCRMALGSKRLLAGMPLQIYVGGTGPHSAIVRWVKDGEVGLGFLKPLPDQLFKVFQSSHVPDPAHENHSYTFDDMSHVKPQRFC